jgi:hypothetical protein
MLPVAVGTVFLPVVGQAQQRNQSALALTASGTPPAGLPAAATARAAAVPQGAPNARLLPDISLVGDLIADLSPDGTTQEDGTRLGVREVELALQAAVDPSFRGDVFIGFSDAEGVAVEQAFITATTRRLIRVTRWYGR